MRYTVYLIKHINGNVIYVGQTSDFDSRKKEHLRLHSNIKDKLAEIGLDNISIESVAEFDTREEALMEEDRLIRLYNTIENGFNKRGSGLITKDEGRYKEQKKEYYASEHYKEIHNAYQREYMKDEAHKERQRELNREYMREYRKRKKKMKSA